MMILMGFINELNRQQCEVPRGQAPRHSPCLSVEQILAQNGAAGICGELVDLGEWYDWLNK